MSIISSFLKQPAGQQLAFLAEADPLLIAETLVAFANSEGGTLVLGAEPGGVVGSITVADVADDALRSALRLCKPPVQTQWDHEQRTGGIVVLLRVDRSGNVHSLSDGRVLVRRGVENVPADRSDVDQLMNVRSPLAFELQPTAGAQRDDLDENVIEEYLEKRQKRNPRSAILPKDKLLQQIGAITEDKTPTNSGILLFGKEPQLFLPQSRAVFVKFSDTAPRGPGGSFGYGRREELIGPLPKIIDRAYRVMWEEMDKRAVVRGLVREEQLEYPESAVREALVNAVAHRDYQMSGRSIEIRMYTDRMEIISPGGLPAHITLDNIVEEHYSRNPRLVNGLYQWGYIEELGLGIDRMIEDMVALGHPPPKFDAKPHLFTVTLYNIKEAQSVVAAWENNMNERQMKAIDHMQRYGSITNGDYQKLCQHVGAETLRLDLADLVNRGILLKIGDKRGTRYILK
ncbi:MAG: ATP-binding protein [Caldilineaceae bacterium]